MSNKKSSEWTAQAVAGAGVGAGLSIGGSYYIMKNSEHREMHLYILGSIGFGGGISLPVGLKSLKTIQKNGVTLWDDSSFSSLNIGTSFSANNLNLATGSEYSAGVGVGDSYFYCTVNATKGTDSLINFSDVSGKALAIGASAYSRAGLWVKIDSLTY
jgi:hypothetical protein